MVVTHLEPTIILMEPVHKCNHESVLGCKYRGRHLAALSLSHRHLKCGFTRQDYQPYVWVLCIIYNEYQWIYYNLDLVDVVRGWANALFLFRVSRGAEYLGMDRKWAKVAYSHALGQCVTCRLDGSTVARHRVWANKSIACHQQTACKWIVLVWRSRVTEILNSISSVNKLYITIYKTFSLPEHAERDFLHGVEPGHRTSHDSP